MPTQTPAPVAVVAPLGRGRRRCPAGCTVPGRAVPSHDEPCRAGPCRAERVRRDTRVLMSKSPLSAQLRSLVHALERGRLKRALATPRPLVRRLSADFAVLQPMNAAK